MITGNILNAKGASIILSELGVDSIRDLDSLELDDIGLFRFKVTMKEPGFYVLKISPADRIVLLADTNEEIDISADLKKEPFQYIVNGSNGSALLKEFYDQSGVNLMKADSLRSALMENRDSPAFYRMSLTFDTLFQKLVDNQRQIEIDFINRNSTSLASLIVLNYKFGMMPVLRPEQDYGIYKKIDSTLSLKYPENRHVIFHHERVKAISPMETGKQSH